jgi:hypothetical protein
VAQIYYKKQKIVYLPNNNSGHFDVWGRSMANTYQRSKKILFTEMDVLRRSARKSRLERIKNEHIEEIMRVKEKPDIIDIIERKRLQWYGHVKRMQQERLTYLLT